MNELDKALDTLNARKDALRHLQLVAKALYDALRLERPPEVIELLLAGMQNALADYQQTIKE